MEEVKIKKRAAFVSICSNSALIVTKLAVGVISGSFSIISEAVHSFTDLLASILAYYSVKMSSEPADNDHQFGHEKFEDLSGGIEGALILIAACYIIYEAVMRINNPPDTHIDTSIGMIVMFISILVNGIVSEYLFNVAKKTDSIALMADAQHLRADIYTSFGVLAGLAVIKLTDITILDPLIAILIAMLILKTGYDICKAAVLNLLDTSLPEDERKIIENTINNFIPDQIIDFGEFKTRKAGSKRLIEFNLVVPTSMTIKEGHDLCDRIESVLKNNIRNLDITIHLEPCSSECSNCILYHKDSLACHKLRLKSR